VHVRMTVRGVARASGRRSGGLVPFSAAGRDGRAHVIAVGLGFADVPVGCVAGRFGVPRAAVLAVRKVLGNRVAVLRTVQGACAPIEDSVTLQ